VLIIKLPAGRRHLIVPDERKRTVATSPRHTHGLLCRCRPVHASLERIRDRTAPLWDRRCVY
jgi:hypothetical protein